MHSVWIVGGAFGLFALWMLGVDPRWIGASAVAWLGLSFNSIVSVKNQAESALSSVSVMLKKRFDLIPSLVDTVQRYLEHESSVLEEVVALRARASAPGLTAAEIAKLDGQAARAITQVLATAEGYPELKASEPFQQLQASINEAEEQISAARRTYNAAVKAYNDAVQMFPTNVFAAVLGYRVREFFEPPAGHDATPDVMARFRSHERRP
jgi:LemA protein